MILNELLRRHGVQQSKRTNALDDCNGAVQTVARQTYSGVRFSHGVDSYFSYSEMVAKHEILLHKEQKAIELAQHRKTNREVAPKPCGRREKEREEGEAAEEQDKDTEEGKGRR